MNISRYNLKYSIAIFAFSLVFYSLVYGNSEFFSRGEAREALVTFAMYESGNYVLPLTKAEEISCKPPALHWLGAATAKVSGGLTPRTIRFPSVFLGSLTLALLFLVFASISSSGTALLGVLILGTSVEWLRSAGHARVDMCLSFGLTFALIAFYKIIHLWEKGFRSYWHWLILSFLASTFAVLSKGPMGLVVPIAITGIYFLLVNKDGRVKKALSFILFPGLPVLVLSLLLSGLWYYLAYGQQGDLFYKVHVVNENLARFIDVPDFKPGHRKPFFFSAIYLITSFLPWTICLPLFLAWLWKQRSRLIDMQENGVLFAVVWLGVVFLMTTVSSSKRSVYFLPAMPALAYLMACCLSDAASKLDEYRKTYNFSVYALGAFSGLTMLVLVIVGAVAFIPQVPGLVSGFIKKEKDLAQFEVYQGLLSESPEFFVLFLAAIILGFFAFKKLKAENIQQTVVCLSSAIVIGALSISLRVLPAAALAVYPVEFVQEVESRISKSDFLYQYKENYYALTYYSHRRIPHINDLSALTGEYYLIVSEKKLAEVLEYAPDAELVTQSNLFGKNGRGILYLYKISAEVQ